MTPRYVVRRTVAIGAVTLVGVLAATTVLGGRDAPPPDATAGEPTATTPPEATPHEAAAAARRRARRRIASRLRAAVERAARHGGRADAAVMLDGWTQPVVARAGAPRASGELRMWSVSKVVTAVTLLRAMGWGDRAGKAVGRELRAALHGALVRSENCRQRRLVLGLQELAGSTEAAAERVEGTLAAAATRAHVARDTQLAEPTCATYLAKLRGVRSASAPGLQLGTSHWRMAAAARFAHTLGSGGYGRAVTARVLALMRRAKRHSREALPGTYTAKLGWGAGRALRCLRPAYKAGWGGARARRFVAEQIAIVRGDGGATAAIAVAFRPTRQPALDDPGKTVAPAAIESVMRSMAADLGGHACP